MYTTTDITTPNESFVAAYKGYDWLDHGVNPGQVGVINNNFVTNYDTAFLVDPINPSYSKSTSTGLVYYYYYRLMDPNCSNYVIVSAPSTGINFTYNAGNITYIS